MSTTEKITSHDAVKALQNDPLVELGRLRWRDGESTAIRCFAYRKATRTLYVAFRGPTAAFRGYAYHGVSAYRAHQFRYAPSRGHYLATVIKPLCRCTPFEVHVREAQRWQRTAAAAPTRAPARRRARALTSSHKAMVVRAAAALAEARRLQAYAN